MAIIKCPECGKEISDKAPFCPSCGAPIAVEEQPSQARNNKIIICVVVAVVLVLGGVLYGLYLHSQGEKENDAYEFALASNDPQVLQSYLAQYTDAPAEHRDSIEAHLAYFTQLDRDWTNVVVSGSRSDFQRYIDEHPNSPFCQIAQHKIDSIDWAKAEATNTIDAIQLYLEQHPDGEHFDDANDKLKTLNANTVSPEDKVIVDAVFSGFFQSLNNRDEEGLMSAFNPLIAKFLGKSNATRSDVATFMRKIYKSDVESMNWMSLKDYVITKKEVGDQQYEYTVVFSALQKVERTDNSSSENSFRINAKVNPDGRITELNMTKILE